MAHTYASQQPQGFKNHIENVAIVGVGGHVGKFIVEELLKTGKHKVTALSRAESTSKPPSSVQVKTINYDDQSTIVEALRGQDALIITMSVMAPQDQASKVIEAAAAANVPWVLPNEWGGDITNEQMGKDIFIGIANSKNRNLIEQLGKSSFVAVVCGFWYEYSLSTGPLAYGFDFANRTATFYDDGNTHINTSTWPQCGRAVASLLNLKVLPDDENDKSPCLNNFRNKPLYVSSFNVSQKDMLDSIIRVTGDKKDDWKVTEEPVKERYQTGLGQVQKGDRSGFRKLLYARSFYPDGSGDFEKNHGLHNDVLGLPEESLDEYTKVAIDMAKGSQ